MNIFPHLPTAFPWYDSLEKQNRFKKNSVDLAGYALISPADALLPFQFWTLESASIAGWSITNAETGLTAANLNAEIPNLHATPKEGRRYIYYSGDALGINLPKGKYYSSIGFIGGTVYHSEIFQVPDCSFFVNHAAPTEFLRLEWYNDSDIRPIFYNDKTVGGIPHFRNVVYLDSFVHASEIEIEEEGEPDGLGEEVPTFQKALHRHKITDLVPDYLKVALSLMQMHDHVFIQTPRGFSGEIYRIRVTSALEFGGALSNIEINFEEEVAAIKKGCSDNMA